MIIGLVNRLRGHGDEFLKLHSKGAELNATALATDKLNKAMEPVRDCVRESLNKQESLLKEIQTNYESVFGKTKAKTTIGTTLLMAAEAYSQLTQDFTQGVTFYADLTEILLKFQNKWGFMIRSTCPVSVMFHSLRLTSYKIHSSVLP
ncbi:unnamed protein product [Dibothriocephalus latus]|uniref:ALIX V-shaped domain-containing protein n=1 Tax=Dibothriocephalus latus TaxID=60516 RepID=A0A3P7QWG4_DIBLA|nr:unnamed protein product [Dibothriocephalus latus]